MGRKFQRKNGRGGRPHTDQRRGPPRDDRDSQAVIVKDHEMLQRYYDTIIPLSDEERADFWAALRRDLPNSFRFAGSKGHALTVKHLLETRYIPEIIKIESDGQPVETPHPVPWYPDDLAWSMTTPKSVIRKFPPFAAFQKFLVSETTVGNISRQEVVSMIPPLLLDVKPGQVVLDLCAAPGSKSAQLLEMLHQGEESRMMKALAMHAEEDGRAAPRQDDLEDVDMTVDGGDDGRATGLLVANDFDYKRCHLLVHQLKRLSSPNFIVTNHDASLFPSLRLPSDDAHPKYLKFDRILADVPCSGDGTMRKNITLWKDWHPKNALGLHTMQVRILVRALQLLKPGGRLVYSTCSMNPVENESVIAAAIERCGYDSVDIIDCGDQLPLLKRKPGLRSWGIIDKAGRIWNSWAEVEEWTRNSGEGVVPGKLANSMFPPTDSEGSQLPLERCMRVYAHQQDTGGFFITALHKKREFKAKPDPGNAPVELSMAPIKAPAEANGETAAQEMEVKPANGHSNGELAPTESAEPSTNPMKRMMEVPPQELAFAQAQAEASLKRPHEEPAESQPPAKKQNTNAKPKLQDGYGVRQNRQPFEEPFKYLATTHPVIQDIHKFYHLSPRFPSDRFLVRNAMGEPAKGIYYTSSLARDVLVSNEGRNGKFVHGGVKMFMKQDTPSASVCKWRIQSEGLPILHGYIGDEGVITLHDKETLRKLLIEMFPKVGDGGWEKLGEIGERVRDIRMGCCALRIEPLDRADAAFTERMVLPIWKSFHSLNLMLPKEDRSAMLLRIFNDTTPLQNAMVKAKPEEKDDVKREEGQAVEIKDEEGKEEVGTDEAQLDEADVLDAPSP